MNKGLSKFLSHVPTKVGSVDDDKPLPYLPMCEVADCDTLFVPGGNGYPDRRERGKTAVTVNDGYGNKRSICAEHYVRGLVKAGKHPNQELMHSDGSMSPVLVKEHWAKLDAEAKS